jgi:AcrR family transcriptional regulator
MPRISAPTVAEHHRQQEAAILAAAARLFSERGVVATEMKDIAAAVGLSRTALYRYFPDRDHVFLAWAEGLHGEIATAVDALLAAHSDPWDRLEAWIAFQVAHVTSDAHAVGNRVMVELGALPPVLRERIEHAHRDLHARLEPTLAELVDEDQDVPLLVRMIGAAVQGACVHLAQGGDASAALPVMQAAVRRLLGGA